MLFSRDRDITTQTLLLNSKWSGKTGATFTIPRGQRIYKATLKVPAKSLSIATLTVWQAGNISTATCSTDRFGTGSAVTCRNLDGEVTVSHDLPAVLTVSYLYDKNNIEPPAAACNSDLCVPELGDKSFISSLTVENTNRDPVELRLPFVVGISPH
ncbi:hypothetical protein ACIBCN_37910 [Nocardia sp. NPDC051052]|uniref:hypothetical protein n=1 Tax=Nocardia sp. NPDC051052 TaxID=3364322 RepID=UPI0037A0537C